MCSLIKHRGPDEEGYYSDKDISIGMRRLSIIDINTGHQPQHNENEDIWIVFNGEIYNFKDLKEILESKGHNFYTGSDTEVIIHCYEEWGENCVSKLRGPFAFCIYDSKKKVLFLARDRLGLKSLYYYFDGTNFIFSSEIKSILIHDIKKEISKTAINLTLSLTYNPFNFTLFKKIYKVPPASYLAFDLNSRKIDLKKYWDVKFQIDHSKDINNFAVELKQLIEESVRIRLMSDVPLGAFLSGGIDSSSIVGVMASMMDTPVKTFSVQFEQGAPIDETKYSRLIAEYYNTDHTEMVVESTVHDILPKLVWHLDDLITDMGIVPVYLMSKLAREKMTVALTGDGADEVFSGYSGYYKSHLIKYPSYLSIKPLDLIMKLYNHIPSHVLQVFLGYLYKSKTEKDNFLRTHFCIPDLEKEILFPYQVEPIEPLIKNAYENDLDQVNKIVNWHLKYQLPNLYNMKTDKMSMAASLEARVPFLDHKIVEWSAKVPSEYKLKGTIEKYILRLAMRDVLPPEILKRKKVGFGTPLNLWLKTGMREKSGEILDRLAKRKDIIKSEYVRKNKRNRFIKYYQTRVWNLIMLELWFETFIDNDGTKPVKI